MRVHHFVVRRLEIVDFALFLFQLFLQPVDHRVFRTQIVFELFQFHRGRRQLALFRINLSFQLCDLCVQRLVLVFIFSALRFQHGQLSLQHTQIVDELTRVRRQFVVFLDGQQQVFDALLHFFVARPQFANLLLQLQHLFIELLNVRQRPISIVRNALQLHRPFVDLAHLSVVGTEFGLQLRVAFLHNRILAALLTRFQKHLLHLLLLGRHFLL
mmetsp:Transcript_63284/g.100645  ORF Transcript_63284/g.100645 Transcript_63284/m.100645 type:complete len:214 (+) Transcript_63284:1631-2272(+)